MRTTCALMALLGTSGLAASYAGAQSGGSTDEVRAVVSEMLADANGRTSLLAANAGHQDGNFFISSDDGAYSLTLYGLIQFRYLMDFRDEDNTTNEFEPGFQTARTKIGARGHIVSPAWSYNVLGNFSRDGGTFSLQDAYVEYKMENGLRVRWGQFKLPLLREELVDDPYQLAVERSVMNSIFTQGRSQGVALLCMSNWCNTGLAFSDGLNSLNTDFTTPGTLGIVPSGEADWAITGRIEFLFAGSKKELQDFTSPRGAPLGAMLGLAGHYQQSPNTSAITDTDRDLFEYTVDGTLEGDGWNVFGAFVGRWDNLRTGGTDSDFNDFGAVVQGGVRVAENTELFGRWDAVFLDSDRGLTEDNFHFLTFGVNQYIAGHAAKFTADAVISLDETPDLVTLGALPNTSVGLLGDADSGEVVVRLQFQLLF
ncbi:MAG: porin [Phycisphaerales bacterium]